MVSLRGADRAIPAAWRVVQTKGPIGVEGQKSLLEEARFHKTTITAHIGILHESGHPEPWMIAMECKPSEYKVLDDALRWGIDCLFSDFKSRGFSLTKTQLKKPDRIERLILVLTIALYWAVSTGMKPSEKKSWTQKNAIDH